MSDQINLATRRGDVVSVSRGRKWWTIETEDDVFVQIDDTQMRRLVMWLVAGEAIPRGEENRLPELPPVWRRED